MALLADEAKSLGRAAQYRLGPGFGQFVPISPMIASMVEENIPANQMLDQMAAARHLIETIRLAAARQHLDAVLVYEVDATADARSNPLSIGEWTLIGSFILPSQDVKAVGVGAGDADRRAQRLSLRPDHLHGRRQDAKRPLRDRRCESHHDREGPRAPPSPSSPTKPMA